MVTALVVGLLISRSWSDSAGGPLRIHTQINGYRILLQSQVGRPNTWGYLVVGNPTQEAATITKVVLPTQLRVVRLALGNPKRDFHATGGLYQGWPPISYRPGDLLPLPVTIPPHGSTKIFADLVIPKPGRYPIDRTVRVTYHIDSANYTKVYAPPTPDVLYTKP